MIGHQLRNSGPLAICCGSPGVHAGGTQEGFVTSTDAIPSLQEAKRKAIQAALQAGVTPRQIARHFGLPLAAVRKVLTGTE
jgi:hypothetical protein